MTSLTAFSQNKNLNNNDEKQIQEDLILDWLTDLSEKGLDISNDSLKIGKELKKVLNDKNYRETIYPESYTWEQALYLIKNHELKIAFWFFINIYSIDDENKELVIRSILAYDKVFKMDELMVNAFYTYAYLDPTVSKLKDGKPEIVRPDLMEEKLQNVKEIVSYIIGYRNQQEKEKNTK